MIYPKIEGYFHSSPVVTQCHHFFPGRITWFSQWHQEKSVGPPIEPQREAGFCNAVRTWRHKTTTHSGLARNQRVLSAFSSNLLLYFASSESMLPFCLYMMQLQRCLINLLHNLVSLHRNTIISGCNQRSQKSESAKLQLKQRGTPICIYPERSQTSLLVYRKIK